MSIPLPDLDTRRWPDLVEQGLATVVRKAPAWTDHNLHDPGVTLLELLAWAVEAGVFQANRVPEAHLRKFLRLAGVEPRPPTPASLVLALSDVSGTFRIPAGIVLRSETRGPGPGGPEASVLRSIPYTTTRATDIVDAAIAAVHTESGGVVADRTALLAEGLAIDAFGPNPGPGTAPALYVGFDRPLPIGATASIWFQVEGAGSEERDRLAAEEEAARRECEPPERVCPSPNDAGSSPPPGRGGGKPGEHHSARLVWEVFAAAGWRRLSAAAEEIADDTRALSLSGFVRVRPLFAMAPLSLPEDEQPRFYLRARLDRGTYDASPRLRAVAVNAVRASQTVAIWQEHALAAGYTGDALLTPGKAQPLRVRFDASGAIAHIEDGEPEDPSAVLLGHAPATATQPERIRLTLVSLGRGSGRPEQSFDLLADPIVANIARTSDCPPGCPPYRVALSGARFWTAGPTPQPLAVRPDLDASAPLDRHVTLDPTRGIAGFGDGRRGFVPTPGEHVIGVYDVTLAEHGEVPADAPWVLGGDPINGTLGAAADGARIRNPSASAGGRAAETLGEAAARAAASLWAHERLVALAENAGADTLDGLDRGQVLALGAPLRAATGLDFERIALGVPGTRVARARAWVGVDPRLGCARFPGTVTLIVLPYLPDGRPEPSEGLLAAVRRYLERRRVLGTRLVVVGPRYVEVDIEAVIRAKPSAGAERLRSTVEARLRQVLDPLRGGSRGRGWPFGRDVNRGDVLRVIDRVDGVDHVVSMRMRENGQAVECSNICVPRTGLVSAGEIAVQVVEP